MTFTLATATTVARLFAAKLEYLRNGPGASALPARALPPQERADVAAELLASLDEPPAEDLAAVQVAWAEEIERRARRVLTGESAGEPWDEVRERALGRRRNPREPKGLNQHMRMLRRILPYPGIRKVAGNPT